MTEETTEAVLSDSVALTQYGDRDQVRELGSRIKRFLPNSEKMSAVDALSLAQLSIAHGLNPFIGDVWWIPKKGIMVGINGLRKTARRVSPYSVDIQLMRTNEREEHDVPDDAAAYIARLFRGDIMAQMAAAKQPIFPFIGTGVCTKGESVPHTKSRAWVARKRAEADALKAAYDIDFATDPTVEHHGVTINGALVGDGVTQVADGHERSEAELQEISNGLYGDDDAPSLGDEWPAGVAEAHEEGAPGPVIDVVLEADESTGEINMAKFFRGEMKTAAENHAIAYRSSVHKDKAMAPATGAQAGLIASLFTEAFAPDENATKEYHSALKFLFGVDSAKDLTFCQARATIDWLTSGKDKDTGEYILREGVEAKARLCLRQAMLDAGQQEIVGLDEEE